MEVSGQIHAPVALSPGTHWKGGWMGPRDGLDVVATRRNHSSCRDSNPGQARISVTILTELPRLFCPSISSHMLGDTRHTGFHFLKPRLFRPSVSSHVSGYTRQGGFHFLLFPQFVSGIPNYHLHCHEETTVPFLLI